MFLLELWTNVAAYLVKIVWSQSTIIFFLLFGMYFSIQFGFMQIFRLPFGLALGVRKEKSIDGKTPEGDVSIFQSLMLSMAGILGTGNIAGVAFSISVAGPGTIFWMWAASVFGMIIKYIETYLGFHYRIKDKNNEFAGGPMYYIKQGFLEHYGYNMGWASCVYAALAIPFACLICAIHSNTVSANLGGIFGTPTWVNAVIVGGVTSIVVIGGVSSICRAATYLVPFMSVLYLISGGVVLFFKWDAMPAACWAIIEGAFYPESLLGGVAGFAVKDVIQQGFRRAVFSSQSGQGSAAITGASAVASHPAVQGFINMTAPFVDSIVCTFTALIVVSTGVWSTSGLSDALMVKAAFDQTVFPGFGILVSIVLILFSYTSLLGKCYFADRSIVYLFGEKGVIPFRIFYSILSFLCPFLVLRRVVWNTADIFLCVLVFTNLIAITFFVRKVVIPGTKEYLNQKKT